MPRPVSLVAEAHGLLDGREVFVHPPAQFIDEAAHALKRLAVVGDRVEREEPEEENRVCVCVCVCAGKWCLVGKACVGVSCVSEE